MSKYDKKKRSSRDKWPSGRPPKSVKPEKKDQEETEGVRLNKFVAHCGICSRRKAAELIQLGEFTVNGEIIREPGYRVMKKDRVKHKGKNIRPQRRMVYLLINKPKDAITTVSDDRGRRTVMDLVKNVVKERIFPVGRLDRSTTGLLLLTNDGDLATKLMHPSHKVEKVYHVTLDQAVKEEDLEKIEQGLLLEDGLAEVDGISYIDNKGKNEVGIEVHIGKNRIVRRIFEHLGYSVQKLDRVYYAGLTKKDLPRGRHRFLTGREIIMLKHFTS